METSMGSITKIISDIKSLSREQQDEILGHLLATSKPFSDAQVAENDRLLKEMRQRFRLRRYDNPDDPAIDPNDWEGLNHH